ncbi:MAG: hypothetical protein AAF567_03965 [Actinomycetota bacterium]
MSALPRPVTAVIAVLLMLGTVMACSTGPEIDEDFPPGNPVLDPDGEASEVPGDNPVLGSEGPGAIGEAIAETDSTNYALLVVIATLLIGAGVLLVKVERWERNRAAEGREV